jgi:hypothetical protein
MGISSYFPTESEPHLVFGRDGRDQDVPELSDDVSYDPFKVDIFTIGNVLRCEFCNVSFCSSGSSHCLSLTFPEIYTNLDFLKPLTVYMSLPVASERPSADEALQQWRTIRGDISYIHCHWRLRRRVEPFVYGLVSNIFHALWSITRFVGLTS